MRASKSLSIALLVISSLLPCVSFAVVEILKEELLKNTLRHGEIVNFDDGTCPAGEVKEITGGDQRKSIPRRVRCVKRPE